MNKSNTQGDLIVDDNHGKLTTQKSISSILFPLVGETGDRPISGSHIYEATENEMEGFPFSGGQVQGTRYRGRSIIKEVLDCGGRANVDRRQDKITEIRKALTIDQKAAEYSYKDIYSTMKSRRVKRAEEKQLIQEERRRMRVTPMIGIGIVEDENNDIEYLDSILPYPDLVPVVNVPTSYIN